MASSSFPTVSDAALSASVEAFLNDGDETLFKQLAALDCGRNERARLALFSVMVKKAVADVDAPRLARFCRETRFFEGTAQISAPRLLFVLQDMARHFPLAVALLDLWPKDLEETDA